MPEEKRNTDKNTIQYDTSSPFITSPYRSGQEPVTAGQDNVAFEKDDLNANKGVTYNGGVVKTDVPADKQSNYDPSKVEGSKNLPNGTQMKIWYEELKIEDDTNIELANIVIESDPDDANRYFKKADLGDWYRVVMKRRRPKDTEKLLDTNVTSEKIRKHDKEKHKHERGNDKHRHRSSSGQGSNSSDTDERKGRNSRHKYEPTKHRSKNSDHRRHRSSERELSSTLPKSSKTKDSDKFSASLPLDSSVKRNNDGVDVPVKSMTPQAKVIMSKPVTKDIPHSAIKQVPEVKEGVTKFDTKETNLSQAPAPQSRVIMSQPKTASEDVKKVPMQVNSDKVITNIPSQKRPESVPRLNLFQSGKR